MNIRSVSPLIATIVLISLTIAIGAIIVGWGRAYVQKQVSCATMSATLSYKKYEYNPSTKTYDIYLSIVNSGGSIINLKDTYIKIISADLTTSDVCEYNAGGGCTYGVTEGNVSLNPGDISEIKLTVTNISYVYNALGGAKVELHDKSCNILLATETLPSSLS